MGLLPDAEGLEALIRYLNISPDHHVVAYDDEGGAWAGRLLWNLHCLGSEIPVYSMAVSMPGWVQDYRLHQIRKRLHLSIIWFRLILKERLNFRSIIMN